MARNVRARERDTREFDQSQLRAGGTQARSMNRDYSAHFFRWSFARRFIKPTDTVLEIGCGVDHPMLDVLTLGVQPLMLYYVGCDLNEVKKTNLKNATIYSKFNFVEKWKDLLKEWTVINLNKKARFNVIVHMEVMEHMKLDHGKKMLEACYDCLESGGTMIMSTPVYDGKHHAANNIHEYTVDELRKTLNETGFTVEYRFGTFMDIKHIGKDDSTINAVKNLLGKYYDNNALSCIFAPLYPDRARNNLWVCTKE
jgi:2-polyprenyl-3-methyl-5-hydroxy-6-metoxy-1,4-benzoquinol methylase